MTTATDGPSLAEALANLHATKDRSSDVRARYAGATCWAHPDRTATFALVNGSSTGPGLYVDTLCDPCHARVAGETGLHVALPEVVR